ncbi:MAG TPA: hypothetical protein VFF27_02275 [Bacteroidia bacterium]|nr:hypothetical protein [Bacteroidia bacterium]
MRNLFSTLFIGINMYAVANSMTQTPDSLGLPGDNLNLYGVLDLFKKSESPEAFEKALNSSDTKLNNLDLNGDGETDYIRVIDRTEKNMHALVLQIPINEDESQDVAVIEMDKNDDGTANIQIVGDEELYGKNYIIQPAEEEGKAAANTSTPAQAPQQTNATDRASTTPPPPPVIVNVVAWPAVRYVYQPVYVPWVSPWRWRYYPPYWKPWRPIMWGVYYPHWHPYRVHYYRGYTYNVVRVHDMYYSHRVVSRTVYRQRAGGQRSAPGANVQPTRRGAGRQAAPAGQSRRAASGQKRARQQNAPSKGSGGHSGRIGGGGGRANNASSGSNRARK